MTTNIATTDHCGIVLLGASNLTLGWPHLMRAVFARCPTPLMIYTAHGMGRSYVAESGFGWRIAPGILECGLWDSLRASAPSGPLNVLITDLGNDLVYGRSVETVIDAAAEAINRLRAVSPDSRIVLTRPPRQSVESLSGLRFRIFRTLLFPSCGFSMREMIDATAELDDRVQELGKHSGVAIVEQPAEWFGFDPIHIRRRWRRFAFSQMAGAWSNEEPPDVLRTDIPHHRPTMATRKVRGRERFAEQPSVRSSCGQVSAW